MEDTRDEVRMKKKSLHLSKIIGMLIASLSIFAGCTTAETTPPPPQHEHDLSDWVMTKQVTCTEDGTLTRSCNSCEYSESIPVTKTGHDFHWSLCTKSHASLSFM